MQYFMFHPHLGIFNFHFGIYEIHFEIKSSLRYFQLIFMLIHINNAFSYCVEKLESNHLDTRIISGIKTKWSKWP